MEQKRFPWEYSLVTLVVAGVAFYAFQAVGSGSPSNAAPTGTIPATAQVAPVQSPVVAQPAVDRMAEIRACVQQANDAYTQTWNNDCQQNYNGCMSSGHISQTQCYSWYGGSCSLGNAVAAQLSLNLQRNKNDCYREY